MKYVRHNFSKIDKRINSLITKNSIVINLAWYVNPKNYLNSNKNFDYFKSTIEQLEYVNKKKLKAFLASVVVLNMVLKKIHINYTNLK